MPVYKDKKHRTWYVDCYQKVPYGKDRHVVKRGFKTKQEAEEFEASLPKISFFQKVTILQLSLIIVISLIIATFLSRSAQLIVLIFVGFLFLWIVFIRLQTVAQIKQEKKTTEEWNRRISSMRKQSTPVPGHLQNQHADTGPFVKKENNENSFSSIKQNESKRKISWFSGCHDEIELVYEKAEKDENIGNLLSELEEMALSEAENSCGLLSNDKKPITKEMVSAMSERDKEIFMYHLSCVGILEFSPHMNEPKIIVKFSPQFKNVLGCTMFSLLNRIEKIDGTYNVVCFPNATLEMQLPLGGRKGMFKWEMLIMQLYPWLSIAETSYNAISANLSANDHRS